MKRGPLAGLAAQYREGPAAKGEVVIVVGPPPEAEAMTAADIDAVLQDVLKTMSVRDAAAAVAETTGQPRRALYTRALALKSADADDP